MTTPPTTLDSPPSTPRTSPATDLTYGLLVPCHNENQRLHKLLSELTSTRAFGRQPSRVVVVSDESTDGTDEIVAAFARESDVPVELLINPTQGGKARAINQGVARLGGVEIIVMVSADALPEPGCVRSLVEAFAEPTLGVAGPQPLPCGPRRHLAVRMSRLLWDVHHEVASLDPKSTEVTAFRNVGFQVRESTLVDEAEIECELKARGFRVEYRPEARVLTPCPLRVRDYLRQRTRVVLGYLRLAKSRGSSMGTLKLSNRLRGLRAALATRQHRAWDVAVTLLAEIGILLCARTLHAFGAGPRGVWRPIASAKHTHEA